MSKKKQTTVVTKKTNPKLMTAEDYFAQENKQQNPGLITADEYFSQKQGNAAAAGGLAGAVNAARGADLVAKADARNRLTTGALIGTGVGTLQTGSDMNYLRYLDETMFNNNPVNQGKRYTPNLERMGKVANARNVIESGGQLTSPSENREGYIRDWNARREFGLSGSSKPLYLSNEQLEQRNINWQLEKDLAEKQLGNYNAYIDSALQPQEDAWAAIKSPKIQSNRSIYTGLMERPDNYNDYSEDYDRELYDAYYGKGEYDKIMRRYEADPVGARQDWLTMVENLKELWNDVDSGAVQNVYNVENGLLQNEIDYGKSEINLKNASKELEAGQEEATRRTDAATMEAEAAALGVSGEYDESLLKFIKKESYSGERGVQRAVINGDDMDYVYYYANHPISDDATYEEKYVNLEPAQFMSPEQRKTFNSYYLAGMKDEAKRYYDLIYKDLQDMKMGAKDVYETEMSQNEYAPLMVTKRILSAPVAGALGTAGAVAGLFGVKEAQDENNEFFYGLTRTNRNITSARADVWGKGFRNAAYAYGRFAAKLMDVNPELGEAIVEATGVADTTEAVGRYMNGIAYSIADNMVARFTGMGVSKMLGLNPTSRLAGGLIQLIMSGEATSNTMLEGLGKYEKPEEAALRAIAAGIIEWVTEKYSTDRFFENYGQGSIAQQMIANIIPEAQEEGASDVLELALDYPLSWIYGHKTELEEAADRYMTDYNMDYNEAWKWALLDKAGDIGKSMIAGGISGGVMGGGAAINYNIAVNKAGASVSSKSNTTNGKTGQQQLIEAASAMEGTKSQEIAKELQEKQKAIQAGKKKGTSISNYEIGRLATTMMQETSEKYAKIAGDTMQRIVKDQLTEAGVKPELVEGISAAFRRSIENGWKLTKEDRQIIAQSEEAVNLWGMYNRSGAASDFAKTSLMAKTESELAADTEAKATRSVANVIGELTGSTIRGTSALARDINTINKTAKDVNEAVDMLVKKRGALVSEEFASLMKEVAASGKANTKTLLDDAMRIMLAAKTLNKEMPQTRMDSESAQKLWDAAKAEFDAEEAKRVQNYKISKPGEGTAEYDGAMYGTKEWTDKIRNVRGKARVQMAAIAEIAKIMGQHVRFINDNVVETDADGNKIDHRYVHGYEDNATGAITVNIAGMQLDNKTAKNMMVTVAHEMTHWLEQNSKEGYAQLRQFILDNLRAKGVNIEDMLIRRIDHQNAILGADSGESLTIDGALKEIVAESCEGLLASREMMNQLAKENQSLYQKVKSFVRDLVSKISRAIAGMSDSMSAEAILLDKMRDDIAKIWLGAREEALNRTDRGEVSGESGISLSVAQKGNKKTEGTIQNPMVDDTDNMENENVPSTSNSIYDNEEIVKLDQEYREAVERGDLQTATKMLMDKLNKTGGIVPFMANNWDAGHARDVARLIKDPKMTQEIAEAAVDMAKNVPGNAVLIPMPDRTGKVTDNTNTAILAKAISELTGRPVVYAIQGIEHESRSVAKKENRQGASQEELGFRQVEEIPEGTMPVFIDNIVGKGITADAARQAMGGGITLAYTKTIRSHGIVGLKNATVTYDTKGNLIPLSQRFDITKRDTRYSVATDAEYMAAVEKGDMKTEQRMVDEAANAAMPDSKIRDKNGKLIKVYHNTDAEFTVFMPETKGGKTGIAEGYGIYLTDDPATAENYGTRQIAGYVNITRPAYGDRRTIKRAELIKLIKASAEYHADDMQLEYEMLGEESVSRKDLLKDTWVSNYANTYGVTSMDKVYAEVADNILNYNDNDQDIVQEIMAGMAIRDYFRAMDFYNKVLTPTTGIDGIWAVWENKDKGLKANVFLAFDSSQIKEADPVTYDDDGNIIPLSERFNKSKKDIRYSVATDVQEMTNGQAQEAEAENSGHPLQKQFSLAQLAQGAGLRFDEYNLKIYDKDGNEIDGVKNKVTPEMVDGMPFGRLISTAMNGMMTKKGKTVMPQTITAGVAQAQKQMLADLLNMVAQYKNSNLVWEVSSSMLFSALKSNSDPQYNTTVDFGTVCAKTQEIINVMSRVMLEKGRGLTRNEVLKVYNETAKAGLTVPCPVCYVFSRWMGVPSLLGQMSEFQKRFVVTDRNGKINKSATQAKVDAYIREALEKYGDKSGIDSAKTSLQNKIGTQEKNREEALKVMLSETATNAEKAAAKQKHDDAIAKLDEMTEDLKMVEAYNWVTQALCKETKKGSGKFVVDPKFKLTPDSVLFDLRLTGEFAKYEKNWKYRNTRGAGMGKAIMPYSGMSIGDIIYGTTRKTDANNPILADVNDSKNKRKIADGMGKAYIRARMQNLIGGQRLQSTSDFRPEWGLDYLMTFMELQAIGSKVQMYTKVAEAVPLLASMGADINLSIMGKGKGWHIDRNGKYVLDFSDVTGMDYDTARRLKNAYDNVQLILVGMNDTHIRLALADTDIDFVIPWHSSGNSKEVLSSLLSSLDQKLETGSDYTDTQSDAAAKNQTEEQKKLWALRMKILRGQAISAAEMKTVNRDIYLSRLYERFNVEGVDPDCYMVKLRADQAKQIFPYEYWDKALTKKDANQNGRNFIEYCRHFGITPRFSGYNVKDTETGEISQIGNFAGAVYDDKGNIIDYDFEQMADGYWKLLIDRPMYDNDGNYREQQIVDATQARIGTLENGELVNSDMPLKTSAMYGPEYSDKEKTAVDNALAAIKYEEDLKAAGSSVYEGSTELTDAEAEKAAEAAGKAEEVKRSLSVARPDMDVKLFMQGLNESSLSTAQEKVMLKQFKELNMAMEIARLSLTENNNQLKKLLAKENPSAYDREEIRKVQNRITNDQAKIERLEGQMADVTSKKGYAGLMYSQSQIMNRLVSGRSSDEVHSTVTAITKQLDAVTKEIKERQAKLDELRADLSFRKTSTLVDEKSADKVAAMIRKMFTSKIDKQDLMRELTEIRLKIETGQDIDSDVEELAWKVASGIATDGGESLRSLRGTTIYLSRSQVKELLGKDSSMKELRSIFAGTGIKVAESKDGKTGLDSIWGQLCDAVPELDRNATALNQVDELIHFVQDQKRQMDGAVVYKDNIGEIEESIKAMAATIVTNTPKDPAAMKILNRMNALVNEMAAGIKASEEELAAMRKTVIGLIQQGKLAIDKNNELWNDIQKAIKYNNLLTEQSEAAKWKNEKWKLKEQLQSEYTQKLLAEQEKWRQRIERDKTAREKMQSNLQLRKMITRNISRLRGLLINETDQKNIPEHMKGLARLVLEKIAFNDLYGRKITGIAKKDLLETMRVLDAMKQQDGEFDQEDLKLISNEEAQEMVADALGDIESGIGFYNASTGKNLIANLQAFHNALDRIADAVATITGVINAERTISFRDRQILVEDAAEDVAYDMRKSKFKGDWTGRGSRQIKSAKRAVTWGNMTPVYFFRMLKNRGLDAQWKALTGEENRNGLELQKAAARLEEIAEKAHYKDWTGKTFTVQLGNKQVEMTVDQMMTLYAIWKREKTSNPEMSDHLYKGGVYIEPTETTSGRLHRDRTEQKPIRVSDGDVQAMYELLTDEQKEYINGIVSYLSNEMSELGNEASMRMYGIKKYKEKWYFPMQVWDGVKSARSDKGISGTTENRGAHKSWTKRRVNKAQNALVIGNFTDIAVKHIVEMINYNTVVPIIENINKILNYQRTEFDDGGEETAVKRNIRVMFQENYGRDALNYLETFLGDLNGGTVQDQRKTLREAALSMFKKNAVAGSMSVALQQPLSYIRAAMMINPIYLARAISPRYWRGSHAEMIQHSGVAVIKEMGKFDMNFGRSAKDYIAPETKTSIFSKISDKLTILPEKMDTMTWTRMWSAVKLEQHAAHPDMDIKSEEFLQLVAERFNELMQRTQVYDSVLVKSQNMRSQKFTMKLLTSFMAEPTLTLNVLADAVQSRIRGEKGSRVLLAKAVATFMLGALLQSLVKGLMGSGRTPDEKKTWLENFLNKWGAAFLSEIDPLGLIPGYNDLIELIKTGELSDDAMGAIGKIFSVFDTVNNVISGNGKGWYRDLEDTAGQIVQLFTNVPMKNLMRDGRAMYNWITQEPYADRPTSRAVLKYQAEANLFTSDTLLGAVNAKLGEAGFKTTSKAYYGRMYSAMAAGNQEEANEIREYLTLGKGVKAESIDTGLKKEARTNLDTAEANEFMLENDLKVDVSTLTKQYRAGDITEAEYKKQLKAADPELTDDEIWWKVDRVNWQKDTGAEEAPTGYYYRLDDAIERNSAQDINTVVKMLMAHGITQKQILGRTSNWKQEYLKASNSQKVKIRDAIEKVYKAAGSTKEEADKKINKWK